jgi:hypothetical protein
MHFKRENGICDCIQKQRDKLMESQNRKCQRELQNFQTGFYVPRMKLRAGSQQVLK